MHELDPLKESPSQTAGPYVHIGCMPNSIGNHGIFEEDLGARMVNEDTKGERITVRGRIYDGTGTALKDAMIEIWQADSNGLFNSPSDTRGEADPNFAGWGRQPVEPETGEFVFETIKPASVPAPRGRTQAPHISFWIVARGINVGLNTRMYFPEEEAANAADPVLGSIEHRSRVATLIANREGSTYTFDIHIQGENETVFLDI
ncbi:protocatechuate 3,4-dioxygenase subunit alpha [Rhodobacteraceae bacterium RKSG542]|uniref:protocatechuate 3,4-dioxygenase subunit alpha n=1 Tax=Pseudovibrio flavus TaxID=2529854 RepID=UPI0012BC8550|nr:protocatechuate 3,4-dioxygenase subunit alpha [Pseudovibrio flavus]MTI18860.1 protocatechuate 3,4-dioxygenase subunit alpha [Pseudovibrio flavus]